MSNFTKSPTLRQDIEKVPDSERSMEFRESFGKETAEKQKNFLESLIVMRESERKSFAPYTKESLLQIQDIAYACEILLAMSLRDSMLSEVKMSPSWTIASYSEGQLRALHPIYAVRFLLKHQSDTSWKLKGKK